MQPNKGKRETRAKEAKTKERRTLTIHPVINFFMNQKGRKGIDGGRWTPLRIASKGALNSMGLLIEQAGQSCSQPQQPQNPGLRALDPATEIFVATTSGVPSLHSARITGQKTYSPSCEIPLSVSTILTAFDNYFRHCFR